MWRSCRVRRKIESDAKNRGRNGFAKQIRRDENAREFPISIENVIGPFELKSHIAFWVECVAEGESGGEGELLEPGNRNLRSQQDRTIESGARGRLPLT